jgi:hypothetical protein
VEIGNSDISIDGVETLELVETSIRRWRRAFGVATDVYDDVTPPLCSTGVILGVNSLSLPVLPLALAASSSSL